MTDWESAGQWQGKLPLFRSFGSSSSIGSAYRLWNLPFAGSPRRVRSMLCRLSGSMGLSRDWLLPCGEFFAAILGAGVGMIRFHRLWERVWSVIQQKQQLKQRDLQPLRDWNGRHLQPENYLFCGVLLYVQIQSLKRAAKNIGGNEISHFLRYFLYDGVRLLCSSYSLFLFLEVYFAETRRRMLPTCVKTSE